jgi:hypothetical protein
LKSKQDLFRLLARSAHVSTHRFDRTAWLRTQSDANLSLPAISNFAGEILRQLFGCRPWVAVTAPVPADRTGGNIGDVAAAALGQVTTIEEKDR